MAPFHKLYNRFLLEFKSFVKLKVFIFEISVNKSRRAKTDTVKSGSFQKQRFTGMSINFILNAN